MPYYSQLMHESPEIKSHIHSQLDFFNAKKGNPHSFDALDQLLDKQFFRLASWKVAAQEINYRRFFNIHELAAIRIEQPQVFINTTIGY